MIVNETIRHTPIRPARKRRAFSIPMLITALLIVIAAWYLIFRFENLLVWTLDEGWTRLGHQKLQEFNSWTWYRECAYILSGEWR